MPELSEQEVDKENRLQEQEIQLQDVRAEVFTVSSLQDSFWVRERERERERGRERERELFAVYVQSATRCQHELFKAKC